MKSLLSRLTLLNACLPMFDKSRKCVLNNLQKESFSINNDNICIEFIYWEAETENIILQ